MAEIEIAPLAEKLSEEELAELTSALAKVGITALPEPEEDYRRDLGGAMDEDALQEILDRLDEHDAAADVYVPVEFEGKIETSRYRVSSLVGLIEALGTVKEELALDDDEDEDGDGDGRDGDDDDDGRTLLGAGQLRRSLSAFYEGAKSAHDKLLSLHISY